MQAGGVAVELYVFNDKELEAIQSHGLYGLLDLADCCSLLVPILIQSQSVSLSYLGEKVHSVLPTKWVFFYIYFGSKCCHDVE